MSLGPLAQFKGYIKHNYMKKHFMARIINSPLYPGQ
jgi:hypothetical protein